jgi:hypothetical protein
MMEDWKRSSYCEGGHCLEIKEASGDVVAIRSNVVPGEVIFVARPDFAAFIEGVKAGEFDLPELQ